MTTRSILLAVCFIPVLALSSAYGSTSRDQRLNGPVKTVYAERVIADLLPTENKKAPWYKSTYDASGRLITSVFFKQDGLMSNTCVYTYENGDRLVEAMVYDSENSMLWKEMYFYDLQGNICQAHLYDPTGVCKTKYYYTYDKSGNRLEWLRSENDGPKYRKESYKYDSNGRLIEQNIYVSLDALDLRILYTYSRRGDVRSRQEQSGNGSLIRSLRYKYNYDSYGNWISQTALDQKSGKVREITYRTITYSVK
jgi:hypothetical protein